MANKIKHGDKVTIGGRTYPHAERLRTIGLHWDGIRKVWSGTVAAPSFGKADRYLVTLNAAIEAGDLAVLAETVTSPDSQWLNPDGYLREDC